jgi:caa(3)-type oxidase subunit IV
VTLVSRRGRIGLAIGGLVCLGIAVVVGITTPARFFQAYLIGYTFWLGLALGCLGLALIHVVTGGTWGLRTRQIFESGAATLPVLAVLFLPVLAGLPSLYRRAEGGWLSVAWSVAGGLCAPVFAAAVSRSEAQPTTVALAIATVKVLLIALFFMELRLSGPLPRLVGAASVVWLGVLMVGTLDDLLTRGWLPAPGKRSSWNALLCHDSSSRAWCEAAPWRIVVIGVDEGASPTICGPASK